MIAFGRNRIPDRLPLQSVFVACSRQLGSNVYVSGLISTSTGVAPNREIAATVATAVSERENSGSPEAIPHARKATYTASVALPTPNTLRTPMHNANNLSHTTA